MYLRAETPMKFYQKNKENQSEYRADISHHHGPDELRAGLFFGDVQPLCVHRSDDRHGQAHQKTDAADKVEQKSHERQRKKYLPALRKALFFRRLDLFSAAGFIIFRRKFSVGGIRIRRRTVPTAVVSLPLRPDFCLVLVPRRGKILSRQSFVGSFFPRSARRPFRFRFRLILGVFGKMRAAANTEFRVIVGLIAAFSTNLTHALIVLLFAKKVNLIRLWNVRVL